MTYTELLRATVFLSAGAATALAAIAALGAGGTSLAGLGGNEAGTTAVLLAGGWWLVAFLAGIYLGRPARAADGVRDALAAARTATSLPPQAPARIALARLWPIGAAALLACALGILLPGIAAIAAGYALLTALTMRSREAAVLAIEQRDGVKFYVVPNSALRPVKLVRTPGLRTAPRT